MRITPFGYRTALPYTEAHFEVTCMRCRHVQQPKVRLMCGLTGSIVGKRKTCSRAERTLIGDVK